MDGPRHLPALPGFAPDGRLDLAADRRPGAVATDDGVRFEVWAPTAGRVDVVMDPDGDRRVVALERTPWPTEDVPTSAAIWTTVVPEATHGTRYRIRLDGGDELADPASRHQPDGVFGPSAVVDTRRFRWTDDAWAGVALRETVLYELHVGTFTAAGTFDAAIDQLPRLADLGITVIELMPLAQFAGARGWGYDGVFPNAVQHSYGGPEGLARFVEAAHSLGVGVIVDAVYNHFGPEGNVLPRVAPYLTDTYSTPWGPAVNLSEDGSDQVRRLFIDNARMWIADYHADGLRLDAVHAIVDPLALPFLEELHTTVHDLGRARGRIVNTFLESAANDPRMLEPPPAGWGGDAQWNDEFHHGLRVGLTGDRSGYYADYQGAVDLADVFRDNLTFSGRFSPVRGRRHGRDMSAVSPARFVVFDQNHDQIGNRRDGERLGVIVGLEKRKLALAATLLSPFTPMLFMGEEYGDPAPFPFFVDFHSPELLEAVRRGRAEEFAGFDWDEDPPDPGAEETFRSAILRPELAAGEPHSWVAALSAALLGIRRRHPVVTHPDADQRVDLLGATVVVRRRLGDASMVLALAITEDETDVALEGTGVVVDTAGTDFGGPGASPVDRGIVRLHPWSALLALA